MSKRIKLGQFETDGTLVATDPCYNVEGGFTIAIKVKPGIYNCSTIRGKLKDHLFMWDGLPGNLRNSQLMIVHSHHKGKLKFKKHKETVGVDSGQAGFFNLTTYRQDPLIDVELVNTKSSFIEEYISSTRIELLGYKKSLKEKDKNRFYAAIKKSNQNDPQKTDEYFNLEIEDAKSTIAIHKKILISKKYPSYLVSEFSKEFYAIVSDLTRGPHHAGVNEAGTISRSGLGDGGYDLYVAKNSKKEIIACYIKFLEPKELV